MDATMACKMSRAIGGILLKTHPYSCENIVLWRGHFHASGKEQFVNLSINGGGGELTSVGPSSRRAY
jgi:hypothetical protein